MATTMSISFHPPEGEQLTNPEIDDIRTHILNPSDGYWLRGSGDASLNIKSGSKEITLLIMRELKSLLSKEGDAGVYLKYIDRDYSNDCSCGYTEEVFLSYNGAGNFVDWVEVCDEWYASAAFIIDKFLAWKAIEDFMKSGGCRSERIKWMNVTSTPEEANY